MREWRWEGANGTAALERDATKLSMCARQAAGLELGSGRTRLEARDEAAALAALAATLPAMDGEALRRLRECLAQGAPLNHVRAGVYAAGVLAWHRHFPPAHFLWLETEAMRAAPPQQLLRLIASFLQLPTHHLATLPRPLLAACEDSRANHAHAGRQLDDRAAVHTHARLPPLLAAQLDAAFRPLNALLRRLLPEAEQLRGAAWLEEPSQQYHQNV